MKRLLSLSVIFAVIATIALVWPTLLPYLNGGWFSIGQFLADHPSIILPVAICLYISFAVCLGLFVILRMRSGTFIQVSSLYGLGGKSLKKMLNSRLISSRVATVEDNFSSDNPSKNEVNANLNEIKTKLSSIETKRINYLAVAHIPLIVFAGAFIGNNGIKINYWYYQRSKRKAKRMPSFGKIKNNFSTSKEIEGTSDSLLLIVESTYNVDSITPKLYFDEMDRTRLVAKTIGIDSIKNEKTLLYMADQVRDELANISAKYREVHLILAASAPLCFAIGQSLNSTNMPAIFVYEYSKQCEENRPWSIQANPSGNNSYFRRTKN